MKRREWMLAGIVVGSVAGAGFGGCVGDAGQAAGEEQLAQQIQRELDAAATADPATAARTRAVRPVVTCVESLGGNHYRGHFGYINSGASPVSIPVGFFNRFWPPPIDRGQPTTLAAGTQTDVVQVPFDGFRPAIWVLGNHFAIASKFSRRCAAGGGSGGVAGTGGIIIENLGGRGVGGTGVGGTGLGGMGVGGGAPGGTGVGGGTGGWVFESPCVGVNCDDRNPCTADICDREANACTHIALFDGYSCDDHNACTLNDTCQSGECVGGSPKSCAAADECQLAGACDPVSGACSNPAAPDGIGCVSRACGLDGACRAGVCQPIQASACTPACTQCSFGVGTAPGTVDLCSATAAGCFNCNPGTDGCESLTDFAERRLCEKLYACVVAPTHPGTSIPGPCLLGADPTACWCGTNSATCFTSDAAPTQANGPCLEQVLAAGGSNVAARIAERLVDPSYSLGRAFNLARCQGTYCALECQIPF